MAYVQRISSAAEIPSGRKHVLVALGDKNEMLHRGDAFTITVDRSQPKNLFEAHLETAISDAQVLADRDTVFVCIPEQRGKA